MKVAVLRERQAVETRMAATPKTIAKFKGFGATIATKATAAVKGTERIVRP